MQRVRRGTHREQIERHPAFGPLVEHSHPFELTYDSAGFVRLLDTYSHYRLLDENTRQALFAELTDVVDTRYDGRVVRRYNSTLYMAARVPTRRESRRATHRHPCAHRAGRGQLPLPAGEDRPGQVEIGRSPLAAPSPTDDR